MYKRRRTAMPTLPTGVQETDSAVSGSRFSMLGQSPFYRGQMTTGDNSMAVIFASNAQLELLRQAHVIYMDSTVKVVPSLYYQLFTLFVPHADYAFPVFFAFMTRKTMELYEAVMQMMHHLAPEFQPTQVIADFEEAPTAAVRAVFGNDVTVSGCSCLNATYFCLYGAASLLKALHSGVS